MEKMLAHRQLRRESSNSSVNSYTWRELENGIWLRKPAHACKNQSNNAQAMKSSRPESEVS